MSITLQNKNSVSLTPQAKSDGRIWDNMNMTWDEVQGAWDNPVTTVVLENKNSVFLTLENKNNV